MAERARRARGLRSEERLRDGEKRVKSGRERRRQGEEPRRVAGERTRTKGNTERGDKLLIVEARRSERRG